MKKIYLLFLLMFTAVCADTYKAIFDCSSDNTSFIKSRMWLIGKTIDMIEKKGDKTDFIITIHGGCAPMVSKEYDMIVPDEDVKNIKKAQEYLEVLSKKRGVKVIVCAMSLASKAIEQKEIVSFVNISPNSFIDTIGYQNKGYALMTFK